jgi:oxygen-independent coproporphyrinogen III oxidase
MTGTELVPPRIQGVPAPHRSTADGTAGPPEPAPIGLYVHVPFCERKCPYCDFNTYAGLADQHAAYVVALCAEIRGWGARLADRVVGTVFLGGGTPTVLTMDQLDALMSAIRATFALAADAEVTCEANPGTVDRACFAGLRVLGVNRLSMGVQSLQPDELAFLGRIHDVSDVYAAFDAARAAGFDNVNLDFMFGLPGQSPGAWSATLEDALALAPEHISLYSLIVEPETPLYTWVHTGQVPAPDDDAAGELYERAMDRLGASGYAHYEVSNWARPGPPPLAGSEPPAFACAHNLVYWRNGEWLGVGAGAHSHLRSRHSAAAAARRWGNVRPVPAYIRRLGAGEPAEATGEVVDVRTAMGETMLLGLRLLREGVPFSRFRQLHDADPRAVFRAELVELADWGLVQVDHERVRLTARGLMVGNQVFARFV